MRSRLVRVLPLLLAGTAPCTSVAQQEAAPPASYARAPWAATVYGARMSSEVGWEDVLIKSVRAKYVDVYLLTGALSRTYAHYQDGALTFEAEGQLVRYFGDQDHWEFNVVPVTARWHRFPWSDRVASSVAFGLGFSYATELPPVEVEIEGDSAQFLIYWVLEATAGPRDTPWAVSLRLHHRSVAWGLMGSDGGMNAIGLGLQYRFGMRH